MNRLQGLLEEASQPRSFQPDWSVHPGEILAEVIEDLGLTQAHLARELSISQKHLNRIIKGHAGISSAALAIRLENATSVSARFWLSLDMEHRLFIARQEVEL